MTAAAFQKPISGGEDSLATAADLSAKQYFCVQRNSTPAMALCTTAGQYVDGILQNEPASGQIANVMTHGVSKVSCGGTVSIGNRVACDTAGELVVATSGDYYIGRMLQDGVDGDVKAMRIERGVVEANYWDFYVTLAGITDADVVTNFTPGFAGVIEKVEFIVDVPVTTAAKTTAVTAEINAVAVTGGVVTVTSAAATPLGAIIAGTAVTATATFDNDDTISLVAASTTAHAEGSGTFRITYRNEAL